MKITEDIIDRLEKALDMRKKDGSPIWNDDDEIQTGPVQSKLKNVKPLYFQNLFFVLKPFSRNPTEATEQSSLILYVRPGGGVGLSVPIEWLFIFIICIVGCVHTVRK